MNTVTNTHQEWLPKDRQEAAATGSDRYVTGKACVLGHVGPRWTVDGSCSLCRPEAPTSQDTTSEIEEEEQEEGLPVSVERQALEDLKEDFQALRNGLLTAYGLQEQSRRYLRALQIAKQRERARQQN